MSNSIELLYFIQQKCPLYMQSLEEELDVTGRVRAGAPRPGERGQRGVTVLSPRRAGH